MAFTVTDRGTTRTEQHPGTTTTTTSASFTPSAGALLVCVATGQISDSSGNSTFSISDTFTGTTGPDGTGSWHQDTVNWLEGTQTTRVSIFTAKLGASPGTGTVTLTFNYASNVTREFNLTVLEVTGQKTANFTNVNSNGNVVATSVTVTMGTTPGSVSLQVGACFDSAGSATTITKPTGWTEVVQKKPTSGGGIHEVAYAIGLATAAPQWTTLSGAGNTQGAMAIEILIAPTAVSSSDTGSGAEGTPKVALTAAETGSGAEGAPTLSAALAGTETGSGADAATLAATASSSDSGSGVDSGTASTSTSSGGITPAAVGPTVLLFIDTTVAAGTFFRLDDPVRGVLDNVTYALAGDVALDITDESQGISISRGRRSEFEGMSAGSATVSWPNDQRQFDPDYPGSIFYGLEIEGKRLQILFDGITVFDGIAEDLSYSHQIAGVSWVTLSAIDAFGSLARKEFDAWTTTQEAAGARIAEVLDRNEVRFGANRDLDAGVSTLQADNVSYGSNVLNYLQLVAASDLGRLFISRDGVATFRDRHSTLNQPAGAVYADSDAAGILFQSIDRTRGMELVYNRVSVDREGGTKQTSNDTTSQDARGIRSLALSGLLLNDDSDSASMADYLLSRYSTPVPRIKTVSVVLDGMDATKRALVFQADIGDVVEALFTPDGLGAQIDQLLVIEGLSHTATPNGTHTATVSFSTADGRSFFRLDDAARGLLDAGNVLSY